MRVEAKINNDILHPFFTLKQNNDSTKHHGIIKSITTDNSMETCKSFVTFHLNKYELLVF